MPKPAPSTRESAAELAHLREQFEISLAQIRAGQGVPEEEFLAELERYEAELDEADRAQGIVRGR